MTSAKQMAANKKNAQKSTGPKTAKGKAVSKLNALKHGLLSQEIMLPGESEKALTELQQQLETDFKPVGPVERQLVVRIAALFWRLLRAGRAETEIFAFNMLNIKLDKAKAQFEDLQEIRVKLDDGFGTMNEHELNQPEVEKNIQNLKNQFELNPQNTSNAGDSFTLKLYEVYFAATDKVMKNLTELETEEKNDPLVTLGAAVVRDSTGADALSKIARYEAHLDRTFYKCLQELEKRQQSRMRNTLDDNESPIIDIANSDDLTPNTTKG
tara:strand:+ start:659 stop:1465 length:807 start_codon:yes stop_codon:yes gene_type:complete